MNEPATQSQLFLGVSMILMYMGLLNDELAGAVLWGTCVLLGLLMCILEQGEKSPPPK